VSITTTLLEKIEAAVISAGERVRASVASGLAETTDALRLRGARYLPVQPNQTAWRGPGRLMGWSIREAAGSPAPAVVTIYDGRSADDPLSIVAVVELGADKDSNVSLPAVSITEAVFVTVSGTVQGALYLDTAPA
jgi:hypothetical protein